MTMLSLEKVFHSDPASLIILTLFLVLRIEWCKSRARAQRWQEECVLLKEEMRRVLQFLDWDASRWTALAALDIGDGPDMKEGRSAYAFRQADIRAGMRAHCIETWSDVPNKVMLAGDFKDKTTGFVEFS
jgi:hypothetical protein